jgi:hypothetical protein
MGEMVMENFGTTMTMDEFEKISSKNKSGKALLRALKKFLMVARDFTKLVILKLKIRFNTWKRRRAY